MSGGPRRGILGDRRSPGDARCGHVHGPRYVREGHRVGGRCSAWMPRRPSLSIG